MSIAKTCRRPGPASVFEVDGSHLQKLVASNLLSPAASVDLLTIDQAISPLAGANVANGWSQPKLTIHAAGS